MIIKNVLLLPNFVHHIFASTVHKWTMFIIAMHTADVRSNRLFYAKQILFGRSNEPV